MVPRSATCQAAIAFLLAALLVHTSVAADKPRPLLVGATVSLEGKYRDTSFMVGNSFRLWEKQINAQGGLLNRPVKLILYDDKSRKDLVRHFYAKLLEEDKVDLVLSPYGTPLTLVASEITESAGKVMLACAASGDEKRAIEIFTRGIAIAEEKGDVQAAREMKVFLNRLLK